MNPFESPELLEQEIIEVVLKEEAVKALILYNDDVNTFDHVIESLMKVCEHDNVQAEQCTWIIHYKGRCGVKRGDYESLEPMCTALLERGISAEIE
jgi:ATP-dependent Clp protease adaptor protein ClpS